MALCERVTPEIVFACSQSHDSVIDTEVDVCKPRFSRAVCARAAVAVLLLLTGWCRDLLTVSLCIGLNVIVYLDLFIFKPYLNFKVINGKLLIDVWECSGYGDACLGPALRHLCALVIPLSRCDSCRGFHVPRPLFLTTPVRNRRALTPRFL